MTEKYGMLSNRQLFFQHLALPSLKPLAIEIERAEGIYMYSPDGKKYIDLISGVCVGNLGHCHSAIVEAVTHQVQRYMHLMVYGELIQSPQVELAGLLASVLPEGLNTVYLVNSGSEAIEGALKLAKRVTGRTELVGFLNAYHGGTQGALSMLGSEELKYAYRPLLPDVRFLRYNEIHDLNQITNKTACVLVEPVQAEAGVVVPEKGYLKALRDRCSETGALLIFDEIQTGFGRTGKLFALEHSGVVPDILCLAKAMGGGMPIGAFIADRKLMRCLAYNPEYGHITTFGGHPVCSAAALAHLKFLLDHPEIIARVEEKGKLFEKALASIPEIKEVRRCGLLIGVEMVSAEKNQKVLSSMLEHGLMSDPFLFRPEAFRIAPPLIITPEEIHLSVELIRKAIAEC